MTRRILLPVLAAIWILSLGCANMLNLQAAKDRDLGHMVHENMRSSPHFQDNFVSFSLVEIGGYRVVTKNLNDAQEAGKFGYNSMVLLDERNNTKVRTGRSSFTITGVQDGVTIFEVRYTGGDRIRVTLKGPFEGEEYVRQ